MEENKKVIQTLTDEELMDLVGGFIFTKWNQIPLLPPVVKPLFPPVMAVYAISPITKAYI